MRIFVALLLLPVASGFAIGDVAQYDVTGDDDYQIQLRIIGYATVVANNGTEVRAPVVEMVNTLYPTLVSHLFVGSGECETWSSFFYEERQEYWEDHGRGCSGIVSECIMGPMSVCAYELESVREDTGHNVTRYRAHESIFVDVIEDWPIVFVVGEDRFALTGLERGNIDLIAPEYLGQAEVRLAQNHSWQGTKDWLTPPEDIFEVIATDPQAQLALQRFRMDYGEPVPLEIVGRVKYADAETQLGGNQAHDAEVTYGSWGTPMTMEIRLNYLFQATGVLVETTTPRQGNYQPTWQPVPDLGWSYNKLPFDGDEVWFRMPLASMCCENLAVQFWGDDGESQWNWQLHRNGYERFGEGNRTYVVPPLVPLPGYEPPAMKESEPFVPLESATQAPPDVNYVPVAATSAAVAAIAAFWLLRVAKSNVLDHPARKQIFDTIAHEAGIHYSKLRDEVNMGNGQLDGHLRHLLKADLIVSKKVNGFRCFVLRDEAVRGVFEKHAVKSEGARMVKEALEAGHDSVTKVAAVTGLDPSTVSYHMKRVG